MFKEKLHSVEEIRGRTCLLVADIGGTNSNFGLFDINDDGHTMLLSVHLKSKEIAQFTPLFQDLVTYLQTTWNISITHACIAAAGFVSPERKKCTLTNLNNLTIDADEIKQKTGLSCVILLNDFEVIGYGLDRIASHELVCIHQGHAEHHANKIIVGAGTGLGKSILYWDFGKKRYMPVASEGGHADCSLQTEEECAFRRFILETEHYECPLSWEDVLSGRGIQRLYRFFKQRDNHKPANALFADHGPHPDEIFNSRLQDEHAFNTYRLFATFYARCLKCSALDALALGGAYIAGGIAAKNLGLFQESSFREEFVNCGKQQKLLAQIPLYVITDYNVSLYGAATFMALEQPCLFHV